MSTTTTTTTTATINSDSIVQQQESKDTKVLQNTADTAVNETKKTVSHEDNDKKAVSADANDGQSGDNVNDDKKKQRQRANNRRGKGGENKKDGDKQQGKRRDDWFKIDYDALDVENETVEELQKAVDQLQKKAVKKHDFDALKKKTNAMQAKIEEYKVQLTKLREQWNKKNESSKEFRNEHGEIIRGAKDITEQINTKQEERTKLNEAIKRLQADRDALRSQRSDIGRDLGNLKTEADIDQKIKEIENEIETTAGDARLEKANIGRIKRLKQLKDHIKSKDKVTDSIDTVQEKLDALLAKAKEKNAEIKKLLDERSKVYDKADSKKKKNQAFFDEKDKIREREKKLREKMKQTYNDIVAENKNFDLQREQYKQYLITLKTAEAKLRKKTAAERRMVEEARRKKMQEEREKRAAEKKKEEEEIAQQWREYHEFVKQNPYETEIAMSEALLVFLNNTLKASSTKKRGGRKKGVLSIPLDKFQAFDKLGLAVPLTVDALPTAIEGVQEKLTFFKSHKREEKETTVTESSNDVVSEVAEPVADSAVESKADIGSPSEASEAEEQKAE